MASGDKNSISSPAEVGAAVNGMNFQAMETPLLMSGFRPEAIQLWQQKMAGTGLEMIAASGVGARPNRGTAFQPRLWLP